jgi:conjugal transfer mating pair stabilization protein TraG
MDFEYFTTGGGWFLFNFFNAIAAIAQSNGYQQAITAASVAAGGWMLMSVALTQRWNTTGNWIAVMVIVVNGFMTPSATVKVTDNLNRVEDSAWIVENVPYGLAFFAGLTSQIGQNLTIMFEQNFSDTDAPDFLDHGFLFGVKLVGEVTRLEVKDVNFNRTLSSYIRNCVFYDILQGRKNLEELKTAADPWEWIVTDPHVARMFETHTVNGNSVDTDIVTCADGITDINTAMQTEITEAERRLAQTMASVDAGSMTDQAIQTLVTAEVGSFHDYLIGASITSTELLQRQLTINALLREPARWMGETGNQAALKDYIDARLQLQTRQSYESIGRQAERWLPLLKSVFQCLYIAIFPIALLLMITPAGTMIIKNYLCGLIWVESWSPLYAVLNYIMTSSARTQMQSVLDAADSGTSITLFGQAGIQAVENDIAAQAGYLTMSVPFISAALAYGVSRFSHLATSSLAVSQEAVAETTRDTTTGNFSHGNTSTDTHSFHNRNGYQHNTSPFWSGSGHETARTDSGAFASSTGDGSRVVDSGGAWSKFPTSVSVAGSMSHAYSTAAADSAASAEGLQTRYDQSVSTLQDKAQTFSNNIASDNAYTLQSNTGESTQTQADYQTIKEASQSLVKKYGVSDAEAIRATVSAGVGFQVFGNGGRAEGLYQNTANSNISYEDALNASQSAKASEAINRVTSAGSSESAQWTDRVGVSFADTISARYAESESLSNSHDASLQMQKRFEELATRTNTNSVNINEDHAQPFYEWLSGQSRHGDAGGSPMGFDAAQRLMLSRDAQDVAERRSFMNEYGNELADRHIDQVQNNYPEADYYRNAAAINNEGTGSIDAATTANKEAVPNLSGVGESVPIKSNKLVQDVDQTLSNNDAAINAGTSDVDDRFSGVEDDVTNEHDKTKLQRSAENLTSELFEAGEATVEQLLNTPSFGGYGVHSRPTQGSSNTNRGGGFQ